MKPLRASNRRAHGNLAIVAIKGKEPFSLLTDIELPGAMRSPRRRVKPAHAVLTVMEGLLPVLFLITNQL